MLPQQRLQPPQTPLLKLQQRRSRQPGTAPPPMPTSKIW